MAARGLVNGRGPPRSGGRDSAKRVVSDTYTQIVFLNPLRKLFSLGFCLSLRLAEVILAVLDQQVIPACYLLDMAGIYAVTVKIRDNLTKELEQFGV